MLVASSPACLARTSIRPVETFATGSSSFVSLAEMPFVVSVRNDLTSRRFVSSGSSSFVASSVSLPAIASALAAPPLPVPVVTPRSASDFTAPPIPVLSETMPRSCDSRPVSWVSANRGPLRASASVVAFGTRFSVSSERMKSTVELYWSTNAWILPLTAPLSGAGAPTVTEVVPVAFSVSCRPGTALWTTLLRLCWRAAVDGELRVHADLEVLGRGPVDAGDLQGVGRPGSK